MASNAKAAATMLQGAGASSGPRSIELRVQNAESGLSQHESAINTTADMLAGVIDGSIPLAGASAHPPSPAPGSEESTVAISQLRADVSRRMGLLEQKVAGGTIRIGAKEFVSEEDTYAWAAMHFPENSYQAIPSLSALFQMISSRVVYNEDAERSDLHAAKVKRTTTQSAVIASKMTTYPPVFEGAKDTASGTITGVGKHDFGALKTFDDWSTNDGMHGLYYQLKDDLSARGASMTTEINTTLFEHEKAAALCTSVLDRVLNFGQWFLDRISSLYRTNLTRAAGSEADATKEDKKQAWESVTGGLKIFFEQVRKINVKAENAHHLRDGKRAMGIFLHAALEELRLEEDFHRHDWVRHPLIHPAMLHQIYLNYVPKSQLTSYCGNTSDLKKSLGTIEKAQTAQGTVLDKLSGRVGTLETKSNQLKQQLDKAGASPGGPKKKRKVKKKQQDDGSDASGDEG